jgi:hypothetical protein
MSRVIVIIVIIVVRIINAVALIFGIFCFAGRRLGRRHARQQAERKQLLHLRAPARARARVSMNYVSHVTEEWQRCNLKQHPPLSQS